MNKLDLGVSEYKYYAYINPRNDTDKSTIIYYTEDVVVFKNNLKKSIHRRNLPAVIGCGQYTYIYNSWYNNGVLNNLYGPACIGYNTIEYWIGGVFYTQEDWKRAVGMDLI